MRYLVGANGYREARKWLRGVDLNHRPLGYECVPAHFPHTRIEDNSPCANSLAISRLSGGGLWQKGELTGARTSDSNV
jgi:hypothetical protein